MRATRYVLFGILAATIAAVIALIITSNVERGPTNTYELVTDQPASQSDLRTDAAAIVRRLEGIGYSTAQAQVVGGSIQVVLYGSAAATRSALLAAIAQDRIYVRPVECAAPEVGPRGPGTSESAPMSCAPAYLITAAVLKVDTKTGIPTEYIGADPSLAGVVTTAAANETGSQPALLRAGEHSGFGGERLLVGPSAFGNSGIASASDQQDGSVWTVDLSLVKKASQAYDVLAQRQFHAYIAVELDGTVVETSLVQPTSTTYATFGGTFEISASLTKSQAVMLADNVTSPLTVPLSLKA
jgi:hypothetical protein